MAQCYTSKPTSSIRNYGFRPNFDLSIISYQPLRYYKPSSSSEMKVELKKLPFEDAKTAIATYFKQNDGREIDYVELFERFHFDLKTIVEICDALVAEGRIG